MPQNIYLLLGAYGDLCAMLPFFEWEAARTGVKTSVVVAAKYADLFEGVTYVDPIIFDGEYSRLAGAKQWAARFSRPLVALQVYGNGVKPTTDSFVKEMWRLAGRPLDWDSYPLRFDFRDKDRETVFIETVRERGKDMILVAANGKSSPFASGPEMLGLIRESFPDCSVIDLSSIHAEKPFDLIGLYDAAKVLVTIDTVHAHLSRASEVPVVALVTDKPSAWHGAPEYSNQVFRMRYGDYALRHQEMLAAIRAIVYPPKKTVKRRLWHVYSEYTRTGDGLRRHRMARKSWEREYRFYSWKRRPMRDTEAPRNTRKELGDIRELPFVHDLVNAGAAEASDTDIIVLSNDDTCFVGGITQHIVKAIESNEACYARRWDTRGRIQRLLEPWEIRKLQWYPGSDLFCFTVGWWNRNKENFPDMALGCEAWDWIMRELIRSTGGSELYEAIYHERHPTAWERDRMTAPANIHNRRLARAWLTARGHSIAELAGIDEA